VSRITLLANWYHLLRKKMYVKFGRIFKKNGKTYQLGAYQLGHEFCITCGKNERNNKFEFQVHFYDVWIKNSRFCKFQKRNSNLLFRLLYNTHALIDTPLIGYASVRPFLYFDHFHIFDLFCTLTHRLYFDQNFTSTKTVLRPVLLDQ